MTDLADVADINPRIEREQIDLTEMASFVGMANVSEESGSITTEEVRPLVDLLKGFTPFIDGDILVAKITPCFENGKIVHARISRRQGFGSTEFHVLRPQAEKLDNRYLFHFLRQPHIRIEGERRMTGSAGQRRVPRAFLEKLQIPLPTLPEQRRIAAILDKADALRAKRREAIAKLDQLLQAVFLDMFGDPESNPRNWPLKSLEYLCDPQDRVNYGVVQPGAEFLGGVPVIRVGDIDGGNLDASSIKRIDPSIESAYGRSRLKGNELLISCVGSIGIVAAVPNSAIGFNIARAITRVPLAKPKDRTFVQQCLLTPALQRYFKEKTRTVSQPTLNVEFVKAAKILDPPPALVGKYCQVVADVDGLKRNLLNSSDGIERNFSSIQQRAFAGTL
ncbi:MAG: restriction endonuclease subunit S [Xanthomonadales bacterium]|nr:restriction endonuclease subunit S [Xanthomonadales bacterium]